MLHRRGQHEVFGPSELDEYNRAVVVHTPGHDPVIRIEENPKLHDAIIQAAKEARQREEQERAQFMVTKIEYLSLYPTKVVAFFLSFALALLLWISLFVRAELDGVSTYMQYFTNWMFTFNVVFYTGDVVSYFDWTGSIQHFWIAFVWWPFFANVAQVFWLVIVLLVQNPDLLMESADEYGLGLTLAVERFIHVIPFVFCLLWGILRVRDITHVMARFPWADGYKWLFVLYVAYNLLLANAFLLCYWANYDFYEVYNVSLNPGFGIVLIEIIYLLHNTLGIILFSPICRRVRDMAYKDMSGFRLVQV
jgi:hypothetical protein